MARRDEYESRVEKFLIPIMEENNFELVDVEYVKEAGTWYLRAYIDKEGGVDINDCEAISRAVDPILDEKDPIPDSYSFEVCSAGLERELKRPSDFAQFLGSAVTVKLYKPVNGLKEQAGTLAAYEDGAVTIRQGEKEVRFEKSEVAQVRLRVEF